MKIAIITPYEQFLGGVESINRLLINIFNSQGWEVELITADHDYRKTFWIELAQKLIGLPIITRSEFIKTSKAYDVVLCNGEFGFGINHDRAIAIFHGSYSGYKASMKKHLNQKQKLSLQRYAYIQKIAAKDKYVVAVSQFLSEILRKQGIVANQVINNPVIAREYEPIQGNLEESISGKYLYVGSYDYYGKGIDDLLKLAKFGMKIVCITEMKPPEPLEWVPKTSNQTYLTSFYANCAGLIFPSRFESSGLVVLEAMVFHKPVFMRETGIGLELKKYVNDYVLNFDKESVGTLVEKITSVTENNSKNIVKAQRFLRDEHNFEVFKNSWLSLIHRIAKK